MDQVFDRRVFTTSLFFEDLWFLIKHIPQMRGMRQSDDINKRFIEKIMNVVTAVNGCTYCSWFHAKQAAACGLSEDELKNILSLQFETDASDYELMALLYAQHFAETNGKPKIEMTEQLMDRYGTKTAHHILLIIRLICFGNLSGNTFDAFLSRLKGRPAKNSNVIFEMIFFIFSAPFLFPAKLLMQADAK